MLKSDNIVIKMTASSDKKDHSLEIEAFIKEAEAACTELHPFNKYPLISGAVSNQNHQAWNDKVEKFFKNNDLSQYLQGDFFISRHIEPQQEGFSINVGAGGPPTGYDSVVFRKALYDAIQKQITELRIIMNELRDKSKPIVIHIEKDNVIWKEQRDKYFHQSVKGKRIKMLRMIIDNGGHIDTKTLKNKFGWSEQRLAQEKSRFNLVLKNKLNLSSDIILGGQERRLKGYEINPIFEFKNITTP